MTGVLAWLVAWLLFILLLWFLAARAWGHTILYYMAWLTLIFLVLSHGSEIASILTAGKIAG